MMLDRLRSYHFPFLVFLAAIIVFLFYFYGDIITSPNSYLFSGSADGLKNYFTFLWQYRHGSSLVSFEGMNYPYGDLLVYADAQPGLLTLFRLFPFFEGYEVGFMNLFMLAGIPLAYCFLNGIMREMELPAWPAAAGAFAIVLIAPQMHRFMGHYGLSCVWAIPAMWYIAIRWLKNPSVFKWPLAAFFVALFLFFLHPYLGVISLMFVILGAAIHFLSHFRNIDWLRFFTGLFIICLSVLVFKISLSLADNHVRRPDEPHGFYQSYATLSSLLNPKNSPFKAIYDPVFLKTPFNFESYVFLGTGTIFTLLLGGSIFLFSLFRGPKTRSVSMWFPFVIAGVVLLLYSMCLPFRWNMEWLADTFSIVKQFRALGRFAWPFFFVSGIMAVIIAHQLFRKMQYRIIPAALFVLFFGANVIEAISIHRIMGSVLTASENVFSNNNASEIENVWSNVNEKDLDAIIPLPFYHIGSEHIFRNGTPGSFRNSLVLSTTSGLPLVSSSLARTSIEEAENILGWLGPPWTIKSDAVKIAGRQFLLLRTKEDPIDKYEENLIKRSEFLTENDEVALYRISGDSIATFKRPEMECCKVEIEQGIYASDSGYVYAEDFDSIASEKVFAGAGSLYGERSGFNRLKAFAPGDLEPDENYTVSFWFYKGSSGLYNNIVVLEESDTTTNQFKWVKTQDVHEFPVTMGEWSLIEFEFKTRNGPYLYKTLLSGKEHYTGKIYIDNLLIRQGGTIVIQKSPEVLPPGDIKYLYNNYPIR